MELVNFLTEMKSQTIEEALPEELWSKIFETGIEKSILSCVDLCSLSISCKHFNRLSTEDTLWTTLRTLDFPQRRNYYFSSTSHSSSSSSFSQKTFYKRDLQLQLTLDRRLISIQERRLGVFDRKVKRIQREMKVIHEQVQENSGELLNMINDRYAVCCQKLTKAKSKRLHIEKELTNFVGSSKRKKWLLEKEVNNFDYTPGKGSNVHGDEYSEDSSGFESEKSSEDASEEEWERESEGGSGDDNEQGL